MANALGTLFKGIADAIRDKTGFEGTMKPNDFPTKISEITTGSSVEILEDMAIDLDFTNGNQRIEAPDGMAVKSANIVKPSTLTPANIAKGVDIAGVIGTLVMGGGVIEGVKVNKGEFNTTTSTVTIEHNLGCVPDVMILFSKFAPKNLRLFMTISFSTAFIAACPSAKSITVFLNNSGAINPMEIADGHDAALSDFLAGYGFMRNVTTTHFTVGGSSSGALDTASTQSLVDGNFTDCGRYRWIAISGIV